MLYRVVRVNEDRFEGISFECMVGPDELEEAARQLDYFIKEYPDGRFVIEREDS